MTQKEILENMKSEIEGLLSRVQAKTIEFEIKADEKLKQYDEKLAQKQVPFDLDKYFKNDIQNIIKDAFIKYISTYSSPINKIFDNVIINNGDIIKGSINYCFEKLQSDPSFYNMLYEQFKKKTVETIVAQSQSMLDKQFNALKQSTEFKAKLTLAVSSLVDEFTNNKKYE